jgi:ribose transport system substrate-binding protein
VRRLRRFGSVIAVAALTTTVGACNVGDSTDPGDESFTIGVVRFASSDPASESILNAYVDYAEDQGWSVSSVDSQGARRETADR